MKKGRCGTCGHNLPDHEPDCPVLTKKPGVGIEDSAQQTQQQIIQQQAQQQAQLQQPPVQQIQQQAPPQQLPTYYPPAPRYG